MSASGAARRPAASAVPRSGTASTRPGRRRRCRSARRLAGARRRLRRRRRPGACALAAGAGPASRRPGRELRRERPPRRCAAPPPPAPPRAHVQRRAARARRSSDRPRPATPPPARGAAPAARRPASAPPSGSLARRSRPGARPLERRAADRRRACSPCGGRGGARVSVPAAARATSSATQSSTDDHDASRQTLGVTYHGTSARTEASAPAAEPGETTRGGAQRHRNDGSRPPHLRRTAAERLLAGDGARRATARRQPGHGRASTRPASGPTPKGVARSLSVRARAAAGIGRRAARGLRQGRGDRRRRHRRDRPIAGFLDIPERSAKPRERGLTHVIDRGLSVAEVDGLLEVAGDSVDVVKLGWGTALVTANLRAKLERYAAHGIPVVLGGTLTEIAIRQGRVDGPDRVAARARAAPRRGLRRDDRARPEGQARADRTPGAASSRCSPRSAARTRTSSWPRTCGWSRSNATSQAGAWKVIAEARESGTAGIYRADGEVRTGLIDEIAHAVDPRAADLRGAAARAAGVAAAALRHASATSATSPPRTCSRWRRCAWACARTRSSGSRWAAAIDARCGAGRAPDRRSGRAQGPSRLRACSLVLACFAAFFLTQRLKHTPTAVQHVQADAGLLAGRPGTSNRRRSRSSSRRRTR